MESCDVFGRSMILNLLSEYEPRDSEEMLGLLCSLENQLSLTSPTVVMVMIGLEEFLVNLRFRPHSKSC